MKELILPFVPIQNGISRKNPRYPPWFTKEIINTLKAKERERCKLGEKNGVRKDDSKYGNLQKNF